MWGNNQAMIIDNKIVIFSQDFFSLLFSMRDNQLIIQKTIEGKVFNTTYIFFIKPGA